MYLKLKSYNTKYSLGTSIYGSMISQFTLCYDLDLTFTETLVFTSDGTFNDTNPGPIPSWIRVFPQSYIDVDTDDVDNAKEYHIKIVASYAGSARIPSLSEEMIYIVNVTNPCINAVLKIAQSQYIFYVRFGDTDPY